MQITDEMVEAALVEWYDQDPKWFVMESAPRRDWTQEDNDLWAARSRLEMHAALEAALKVSAAPQMLDALKDFLSEWDGYSETELTRRSAAGHMDLSTYVQIIKARAAIAAATGGK